MPAAPPSRHLAPTARPRTDATRPGRSRAATVAVAVVVLALSAACGSSDSGGGTTTAAPGDGTSAPGTATTSTEAPIVPATTDAPGATRFNVYWLRSCPSADTATAVGDCRIATGESRLTAEADILTAALTALGEGPNESEKLAGMTSNVRPIVHLNGVTVDGDVAVVDYNRYFESATTQPQVAQVVYTLTQFPSIHAVKFLVDGAPNGATGTRPTSRADVQDLAPAVLVESPALGGVVAPTFALSGSLAAEDITFTTKVVGLDGAALADGTGAAAPGSSEPPVPFVERVSVPATTSGPVVVIITASDGSELQVPISIQAPA